MTAGDPHPEAAARVENMTTADRLQLLGWHDELENAAQFCHDAAMGEITREDALSQLAAIIEQIAKEATT